MARSIRIEFPGAFYHVMARGNRREAIFKDDLDHDASAANVSQLLRRATRAKKDPKLPKRLAAFVRYANG